ncbi:CGNR zinc finger domain-containing protein [Kibdelosporangium persicum]|uniref:CGNR zinc finger n=1 Tax=Kibdelosporangium persicum TaxID=2698649 RepID=A0ABX2F1F9_9PSEU|nr:CGNR zinc finger domain-containing protein [Kibdelosporangium persicum]NRN65140.1 CGNR zinc finger [Kibdelosporangium persicum]
MGDETLLLALLNSAPMVDGVPRDHLVDASAWLADQGRPEATDSAQTLREAREALKAVVRGQATPVALNPFLTNVRSTPSTTDDGLEWTLDDTSARSVVVHAILAWDELAKKSPGRLRACANPDCELFLIDRSKANNARWCSMAACGNRMKARRHYRRSRQAP